MSAVEAPSSPYKGLAAFEDSAVDALFFFGRDRDSQVIAANLMASRLTVLFGPTGVGKTSVLRAGVAYKLRQEAGVDVRMHSSWIGDPGEALADLAPRTGRDIYLMLDQFEEFFLYHEADRTFVQQLAEVIRRPDLRVNLLIGIREDALALLDAFKAVIPNLLSNRLRLENLDRTAGEAAIRGPLQRFNELVPDERRVEVDSDLVGAVLDEVAAGRVELGAVGRGVVTAPTDDDPDRGALSAARDEQAVGSGGGSRLEGAPARDAGRARGCDADRRGPPGARNGRAIAPAEGRRGSDVQLPRHAFRIKDRAPDPRSRRLCRDRRARGR